MNAISGLSVCNEKAVRVVYQYSMFHGQLANTHTRLALVSKRNKRVSVCVSEAMMNIPPHVTIKYINHTFVAFNRFIASARYH